MIQIHRKIHILKLGDKRQPQQPYSPIKSTRLQISTHRPALAEGCSSAEPFCWSAGVSWVAPAGCSPPHNPVGSPSPRNMGKQGGLLPPDGGKKAVQKIGRMTGLPLKAACLCLAGAAVSQSEKRDAGSLHQHEGEESVTCHPVREQ